MESPNRLLSSRHYRTLRKSGACLPVLRRLFYRVKDIEALDLSPYADRAYCNVTAAHLPSVN